MAHVFLSCLLVAGWFSRLNGELYQDRPKIKTSDGDLVLEPAFNKNIYLRINGPKSAVFVGDTNLVNLTSGDYTTIASDSTSSILNYQNDPKSTVQTLEVLENRFANFQTDNIHNITAIRRKLNRLTTEVENIRSQINLRKDFCQTTPCINGGTCLSLTNTYHCLCPTNWEGYNCDIDVNECRNFAGTELGCQNGAFCINRPGTYECMCKSGWYGTHCTRKAKDCSGGSYEMCGHGSCIETKAGEGIHCLCDQGWTTNGTNLACLTDINECELSQGPRCSLNPKVDCINLPGSFRCGSCPSGFEGDGYTCSDIDECITSPNGGCSTSPLVSCHNTIGSRICGPCPAGYQGDGVDCAWRGSCNIDHGGCHPTAQCVDNAAVGGQGTQCICPLGMEGDGVGLHGCYIGTGNNTRGCVDNPCGLHGLCNSLRMGYTCVCYRGYSGAHCNETAQYCASNPCLNGGSCRPDSSLPKGFHCECTAQYTGETCLIPSKNCGGVIQAEEGSIAYPLSENSTYIHNARCAWVIKTDADKVLNVTFSKFNLEFSPDCIYDFLQIHDGRNSASQIIDRFCGTSLPKGGNIISSRNFLYLWFRSDHTVARDGFALHWTSIMPICGGEVNATTHGTISSPGSPGNYPPNRDCYWHLVTVLGKKIQLNFFALDIETHTNCSYDYLIIYDGVFSIDPLLAKYCDSTQPAPIHSSGSVVMIHFHSDAYNSGKGFQIFYAPVPGVPGCGGLFTNERGEIVSPSYNGRYLSNLLCDYEIRTRPDNQIRIKFELFKLESSQRCKHDYLKVYDGKSANSKLVGTFCGNSFPKEYISSSNTLYLKFKTDSSVSHQGFKITYESLCQQIISGDSGVIKSLGYPFQYPRSIICKYTIYTSPGKAIQLAFQDFDVKTSRYVACNYDFVEIRDGSSSNDTLLGKFCGTMSVSMPPLLTSTHNYMYIKFSSDLSSSGRGFYANFTTLDTTCGGIYKDKSSSINYPSDANSKYDRHQTCIWKVIAPQGKFIKLSWNRFDIEGTYPCNFDYLELFEIDENNVQSVIGKYCGTNQPPALTITSNQLELQFKSDGSIQSHGFSLSYDFLDEETNCGGIFSKTNGYLYSPGWPGKYPPYKDCRWTILAPQGGQIRLNILTFELEEIFSKCDTADYLEIRNGQTDDSPLQGKYCGSQLQGKKIFSFGNSLRIRFHSDYAFSGKGFKIEWDSTAEGCGGRLTSPSGAITSPNYPENYDNNVECFYKISTNMGSRVHINFKDLDLEETTQCNDDYVQIYDGRDANAASLGKYCSFTDKLSAIQTSTNFAFIKFRSDFFLTAKGFSLEYTTICQNNLKGTHGIIESPGFPNGYKSFLHCLWTIEVPLGNKINITFTYFNIPKRSRVAMWRSNFIRFNDNVHIRSTERPISACDDFLELKETKDSIGKRICGNEVPRSISSTTNSFQIQFTTLLTSSISSGFRLEWARWGCGGHIFRKRFGNILIDKSSILNEPLECEWLIEADIGSSVTLNILELYMLDTVNCSTDSIEIYNGESTETPLLTKVCDRKVTLVQSTSNYMFMRFIKHSTLKDVHLKAIFNTYREGCSQIINAVSGQIHSLNYPKNYDNKMDCTWTITVPDNHRLQLTFDDFDLYKPDIDCRDHIIIYDGISSQNYTQIICSNWSPIPIISKSSVLRLQFVTDDIYNAKGFKAKFNMICGATITIQYDGDISNIDSVGYPLKYPLNDCTWTLLAPTPDKKISLTITHLSVPRNMDIVSNRHCPSHYLRVLEGNDNNGLVIDEFCGRKAPSTIVSRGSALTLQLGAYNGTVQGSFKAHYSTLTNACGGSFLSEKGTIASPNYPSTYPVNANCEWNLMTSPGNKVYITFEKFDLEFSENCNEDYLEIRDGNGYGRLLGVYCGNKIPTNTTASSEVYIKFHSDNQNGGQGFRIHYEYLHGNDITDKDNGNIASPLYPNRYGDTGTFTWRITVNYMYKIEVIINKLEIPVIGEVCYNSLAIYDGDDENGALLGEYCGILDTPKLIKSSSNIMYVKLKLTDDNNGSMFYLSWTDTRLAISNKDDKLNCGSNEVAWIPPGRSTTFSSPNYPLRYGSNRNCNWIFKTQPGYQLELKFHEISLLESFSCVIDYISIYFSESSIIWRPLKENICLTESSNEIYNSSDFMKITFRSDLSSGTQKGFNATISSVCGGFSSNLSGSIGFAWGDVTASQGSRIECRWTIKVRPGRVISADFELFNISDSNNCKHNVILRNGDSINAPIIGRYCGKSEEKRKYIETSSNYLFVHYTNYYIKSGMRSLGIRPVFETFKLHYEEKDIECGLTSSLDSYHSWEIIKTPNYPNIPPSFTECVWLFSGPPGDLLRVDFSEFDLKKSIDCLIEYIEVRDGYTELAPLKLRFCNENPGTIKSSGNSMYIRYVTHDEIPNDGFKANVSIDVCGGTIVASRGVITSPDYPSPPILPAGSVCMWRIVGPPHQVLNIHISDLSLPEPVASCATKLTIEEPITVNNSLNLVDTRCAEDLENEYKSIETSSNEAIVKLYIGKRVRDVSPSRGFRLIFNTSRSRCGGVVSASEGFLLTPNYPRETSIRYCQWFITVPDKTRRVTLELLDSNVEKHRIGLYNDLKFRNILKILYLNIVDRNASQTSVFKASGNQLGIYLFLNPTANSHRFKAKFTSNEPALCGGKLSGLSGALQSPDIDQSYSCFWHYSSPGILFRNTTQEYKTLYITIDINSTTTSNWRCRYSDPFITLRSELKNKMHYFFRILCNGANTYSIPSTQLEITAAKLASTPLDFQVKWKLYPCGGIQHVGEDPVNILNVLQDYNDTLECAWLVEAPTGTTIQLTLEGSFQMDCSDEIIRINQGLDQLSATVAEYCKDKSQEHPLITNYRNIIVQYHSKRNSNIKLMLKIASSPCGGLLTMYNKIFSSPNYPHGYGPNLECSWEIKAPMGNTISLQFLQRFVIEARENCSKDSVTIYDWKDDSYIAMAKLCGRDLPPVFNSTFNQMKVVLRTDETVNGLDGFKAMWSPICGGVYTATEKEQFIISPGYPNIYPPSSKCVYNLRANKKIHVKFIEFELEGTYPSCAYDNLTISAPLNSNYVSYFAVYCESKLPPEIYQDNIVLTLNTDSYLQKKGFKLSFQTYSCGGKVLAPGIIIPSPANGYDDNLNCTWSIEAPHNKVITLKILYIDLESTFYCNNDFLAIYNGPTINEDMRLALLCGRINSTTTIKSTGSTMLLQFVTDGSVVYGGFKADVGFSYSESVGCGGHVNLSSSSEYLLKSPRINSSVVYENFLDCLWNVYSPDDYLIKIEFISFHIAPCEGINQTALGISQCACDYVQISDGINPLSPVMGIYCGHELPPQLISSGTRMAVRLVSDGGGVSAGFELKLSVQRTICGQSQFKITNKEQRIESPGYSSGAISRGLHCIYRIESENLVTQIRLTVNNIDLRLGDPNPDICNKDKLIITSQVEDSALSGGKDFVLNGDRFNKYFRNYVLEPNVRPSDQYLLCGYKQSLEFYLKSSSIVELITSFESDSLSHRGVQITATTMGPCGRNYSESQGRIVREAGPEDNTECYTLITAPENFTISAYFLTVSRDYLQASTNSLTIYNGNDTKGTILYSTSLVTGSYTEDDIFTFSTGRYLLLRHQYISYDMIYMTTDKGRGCGGQIFNVMGRISSPMYPSTYRLTKTCVWEIETPVNTRVHLRFDVFDMGGGCETNFVAVSFRRDSADEALAYCAEPPAPITSVGNYMRVALTTDAHNTGSGWVASFVAIE